MRHHPGGDRSPDPGKSGVAGRPHLKPKTGFTQGTNSHQAASQGKASLPVDPLEDAKGFAIAAAHSSLMDP